MTLNQAQRHYLATHLETVYEALSDPGFKDGSCPCCKVRRDLMRQVEELANWSREWSQGETDWLTGEPPADALNVTWRLRHKETNEVRIVSRQEYVE